MSYKVHTPLESYSGQMSSHQHAVIEAEWWGWDLIDLLLDIPVMLIKDLFFKLRKGVRRAIFSQHARSYGQKRVLSTSRRLQQK